MNEKTAKPMTIIQQEFIEEIIKNINNSQLPIFVVEYILRDILNDIRVASQRQLEIDMKNYKKNMHSTTPEANK